jgi:hypothetical protein
MKLALYCLALWALATAVLPAGETVTITTASSPVPGSGPKPEPVQKPLEFRFKAPARFEQDKKSIYLVLNDVERQREHRLPWHAGNPEIHPAPIPVDLKEGEEYEFGLRITRNPWPAPTIVMRDEKGVETAYTGERGTRTEVVMSRGTGRCSTMTPSAPCTRSRWSSVRWISATACP